ncbi:hypothetical protein LMG8323_04266 [Ralstonia mannitolilytica]|nr:hypothetical protein LMG8323_04266 [Ralstonia mannitolilytica]
MRRFGEWFQNVATEVVEDFYAELAKLPRSRRVLDMLSADELAHLKHRQVAHLSMLAGSDLTTEQLEATSRRLGKVHAIVGVDRDELVIGRGLIMASVTRRMAQSGFHDESGSGFAQTLTDDLTWQLQVYQALEDARQDVLQRITRAVWVPSGYTALINEVVAILAAHEPIAGCAIGRPDQNGVFHIEAAATRNMNSYFADLLGEDVSTIVVHADQPGGQGPVGRAWRERQIERIINFSTDPQAAPWREVALAKGLRSCIAIPLGGHGEHPLAVLLAYSALPGGFISLQQSAFFDMVQTLLGGALARLDDVAGMRVTIPFTARNRLAALVRSDALVTYYQPLMDVRTWTITKVEALARLRGLPPEKWSSLK